MRAQVPSPSVIGVEARGVAKQDDGAPVSRREAASRARREAIAEAALDIFVEKGFAAARMDDVAARAGVAKGTIYLHFKDKEALFEEIVRTMLVAPLSRAELALPREDESARGFLERSLLPILLELAGTRRGDVVRLLIAEGARFPRLAETYHHEVIQRGLALMAGLGARARARGEPGADVLEKSPQLVVAPALVGLIWSGLFARLQPLDVRALVAAQLDLIFGPRPPD